MANDPIQKLREAIVAVLDAHADVAAITGRATENVVAWGNLGAVGIETKQAGLIAYHFIVSPEVAADQKPQRPVIQFGAVAAEESIANELIGVIARIDAKDFLALVPPLDAHVTNRVRRSAPTDDEGIARADIDITLQIHFP